MIQWFIYKIIGLNSVMSEIQNEGLCAACHCLWYSNSDMLLYKCHGIILVPSDYVYDQWYHSQIVHMYA